MAMMTEHGVVDAKKVHLTENEIELRMRCLDLASRLPGLHSWGQQVEAAANFHKYATGELDLKK